MTTPIRRFGNSFLEYRPNQEFQLSKGEKMATGKAVFVLDFKDKLLSVRDDNTSRLQPGQTTDLFTITKWVKKHLASDRELQNHTRDPDLLFRANRRVNQLNVLIDRHNTHVDRSVWIEFVHVILLILTLGIFDYRDSLRLKEIPKLDIANHIHKHPGADQQADCAAAITLYDLIESEKPGDVLKDVGMAKEWETLVQKLGQAKDFDIFAALRTVKKEGSSLDEFLLTPLPSWKEEKFTAHLQALVLPKETIEGMDIDNLDDADRPTWDVLLVRMAAIPQPANFKEPANLRNFPLAHIRYLKNETLYAFLKNGDTIPPLSFLSQQQIASLPFGELSADKIQKLFLSDFLDEKLVGLLRPEQLEAIAGKSGRLLWLLLPLLSEAQLRQQPAAISGDLNQFLGQLLANPSLSEEDKKKRVSLVQERVLTACGNKQTNRSKIDLQYIPLLDFSRDPFRILSKISLLQKAEFGNLSSAQLTTILSWIEADKPGAGERLGPRLSEAHWQNLKKEQITAATLPFLFPRGDSGANKEALALLSAEMRAHIKALPGIGYLNIR